MTNELNQRMDALVKENAELTLENAGLILKLQTAESEIYILKSGLDDANNEIVRLGKGKVPVNSLHETGRS